MNLNKIHTILFYILFVSVGFLGAEALKIENIKYELSCLSDYKDEVLDSDFFDNFSEKESALILKNNLSKFDNIGSELANEDKVELLKTFVYFLDVINSKTEILRVLNNDPVFLDNINSLKLILSSAFYDQLEQYANLINNSSIKTIINDFVTEQVFNFLEKEEIEVKNSDLLKIDLCNLWNTLFKRYFAVVNSFRNDNYNFDQNELDSIVKDLEKQRDLLLEVSFTKGIKKEIFGNWIIVKELQVQMIGEQEPIILPQGCYNSVRAKMEKQLKDSIELFDLFILNLLKIKHEHNKIKNLADKIKSLSSAKKEVMVRHLVLKQKEEFQKLKKSCSELFSVFNRYSKIIKQYLDSKDTNKDLFVYELNSVISNLKEIKNANDSDSLWHFITGSKNKKLDTLCSVLENMIQILELINFQISDVSSVKSVDSGVWNLFEKFLSSKKAADLLAGFVN